MINPAIQIQQWWITTFRRFSMTPFIFILIGIELYFYINGAAHFPSWDASYSNLITIYIVMTVFFLVWSRSRTESQLKAPVKTAAPYFVVFFIGGYAVIYALAVIGLFSPSTTPTAAFWPAVIFQICVVATAEELIFRGVVLEVSRSVIISSIIFALFHGYSYGCLYYAGVFNWGIVGFAFFMGVILALIYKKYGLPACIGAHAVWNLCALGILVMPI